MAYLYEFSNSTAGIDNVMSDLIKEVPTFIPMVLVFIYFLILLGGSASQRRRSGSADISMWSTIASISCLMVALPLTITAGIIDLVTLSIVVAVVIISALWFFLSRNRYEV